MNKTASQLQNTTLGLLLLALSSVAIAQTAYVTDHWRFEMRESPCFDCKIVVYNLESGTELARTGETQDSWVQVRTLGGVEGWMPQRYLSENPSARSQLDQALEQTVLATSEQALLREQMALLATELDAAGIDIEMIIVTNEEQNVQIEVPKIIGNLATVGSQNEELLRRNQLLQNELDLRAAEIDRLSDTQWKSYFFYGGAAVLVGALLCLFLTRIRPRSRYSEWA